jgi:hypothetical protein
MMLSEAVCWPGIDGVALAETAAAAKPRALAKVIARTRITKSSSTMSLPENGLAWV